MRLDANATARAFVEARNGGYALPDYPGTPPATLAAAYDVQDRALALVAAGAGGRVAGWKVGKIAPPVDGADRLAGPIFAAAVVEAADGDVPAMPVFGDGFAAAEAEWLLRIGTAPEPGRTRWTNRQARDLIDAVCVGIEVASSPYPGINDGGPAVTVSDFGNNNGLVVGASLPDWRTAGIEDWRVTLEIDGAVAGDAKAADMLDGPFGAARFLFEHAAERGLTLEPGQWISSGAVTGVHPVRPGAAVTARFGDRLAVSCTIAAL